jgi:DNA-binding transcriptional LysR family regulator
MHLRVRVSGFDEICRMVETGIGFGIVPEAAAKRCRRSMAIVVVGIAEPWASRRLAIYVRSEGRLPAPAERLLQHLLPAGNIRN